MPGTTTSVELKTAGAGTWNVPAGVSSVIVSMIAGGAAGSGATVGNNSLPGGGSAEYCFDVPYTVTPGGTVSYTVGAKGVGSTTAGPAGTASIFGSLTCRGAPVLVASNAGAGGGIYGASSGAAAAGSYEGNGFTGGSSGGVRGGSGQAGTAGGGSVGQPIGGAGGASNANGAGGGGAASPWGVGGAGGGNDTAGSSAPSTSYGAGGGGCGFAQTANRKGGDGCDGYILIQYVA